MFAILIAQAVAAAKKEKRVLSTEEKVLVDRVIAAANTIVQVRGFILLIERSLALRPVMTSMLTQLCFLDTIGR